MSEKEVELQLATLKAQLVLCETKIKAINDDRSTARFLLNCSIVSSLLMGFFGLGFSVNNFFVTMFYIFLMLSSLLMFICIIKLTKGNE